MKVLIVDDEPDMKPLFEQQLRREVKSGELELYFAENGAGALKIADGCLRSKKDEKIVAFLDMQLPDVSGMELMAQLQARNENIRIFIISGMADDNTRSRCLKAGAEGFITKPIDFCEIKKQLQ